MAIEIMNTTGIFYQVVQGWNNNVTGDAWLTFFFIMIGLVLIGLLFKLPLDIIFIITLPFPFLITAYNGAFAPVLAFYLVYLVFWLVRIFRSMTSGY